MPRGLKSKRTTGTTLPGLSAPTAPAVLLNMGVSEGTQIIQLFGRGVRLKGRGFSLKRSKDGERPSTSWLRKLETLNVFGIRANYMAISVGLKGITLSLKIRRAVISGRGGLRRSKAIFMTALSRRNAACGPAKDRRISSPSPLRSRSTCRFSMHVRV